MIFNVNIKNKYVDFENISLDFSKYGIYILSGANGVGKSTIMNQLVFGKNKCTFNSAEQASAYNSAHRHELVTYIEQDPVEDGNSIRRFLCKGKVHVDKHFLQHLLDTFALGDINLKQSVNEISGGEFCKINIIAGLLKKTPYIFMDEPTNNFDNEAVRELIQIISSLSQDHTFVIISHDPRLTFADASEIKLTSEGATVLSKNEFPLNTSKASEYPFPKLNLLLQHLAKPSVIFSCLFYFIIFSFSIFMNYLLFNYLHNFDALPDTKNCIVTYKVDQVYATLNETYAKAENIQILDSNKNKMILFSDIPEISSMPEVEKIILSDESYIYKILDNLKQYDRSSNFVSIPFDVVMNFGNITSFGGDLRLLRDGRLPQDGTNEIALSENMLKDSFGLSDYDHAVNKQIVFMNKVYTVVGCTYYDIGIISYNPDRPLGYFEYNPNNYKDTVSDIITSLTAIDSTINNGSFNVIIYTKEGMEKTVLNKLLAMYPAENYTSYEFISTFAEAKNVQAVYLTALCNIIYVILASVAAFLIFSKASQLFKNELYSLEIYYLNKKIPRLVFLTARYIQVGILSIICILLSKFLLADFQNILLWLIIDYLALSAPLLFFYRARKNK